MLATVIFSFYFYAEVNKKNYLCDKITYFIGPHNT